MNSIISKHIFSKDGIYWLGYYIINHSFLKKIVPDKLFLTLQYRAVFGKSINWNSPVTYNEKLQWLKVYDRRPIYTTMVDKYAVKKSVAEIIGEEHIIPTLGVWDRPEDIEWDKLPNQFVLKCTHDSGGLVICRDKETLDRKAAIKKLNKSLQNDYYMAGREWPYKNVPRRIIAERYMEDKNVGELPDYKFFCFNGRCESFKIDFDRQKTHHANYYNRACELMPFGEVVCPPDYKRNLNIPSNVNEMINYAELLASHINSSFVRVDLYNINGQIYFGEITFYPASGFGKFEPKEWDKTIGEWINLPKK